MPTCAITRLFLLLLFVCGTTVLCIAQNTEQRIYTVTNPNDIKKLPKTCVIQNITKQCKLFIVTFVDTASYTINAKQQPKKPEFTAPKPKVPLITIHGNVMYDFYYQSHIDTPYVGNNLYQHTITTFLDVRIRNDYPMRVYFTTRFGNTNYLKDITNLNFQFSPQTFQNTIRNKIKSLVKQEVDTAVLNKLRDLIQAKMARLQELQKWMSSPSITQRLVEEREAAFIRKRDGLPPIAAPTAPVSTGFSSGSSALGEQTISKSLRSGWSSWFSKGSQSSPVTSSPTQPDSTQDSSHKNEQYKQAGLVKASIKKLKQKLISERDSVRQQKDLIAGNIQNLKNLSDIKNGTTLKDSSAVLKDSSASAQNKYLPGEDSVSAKNHKLQIADSLANKLHAITQQISSNKDGLLNYKNSINQQLAHVKHDSAQGVKIIDSSDHSDSDVAIKTAKSTQITDSAEPTDITSNDSAHVIAQKKLRLDSAEQHLKTAQQKYLSKKDSLINNGDKLVSKLNGAADPSRLKNLLHISKAVGSDSSRQVSQKVSSDSTVSSDSASNNFSEVYARKKRECDSLKNEIQALEEKYLATRDHMTNLQNSTLSKINAARNSGQLNDLVRNSDIPDSALPKGYKTLLAIKKFGIGTSTVDYSELSAKNITITGLQAEYSPKFYYAVAAGVIDYRFRNYLVPQPSGSKQYLGLLRFGKETKNGNSLILTYYYGRKVLYNYYTTDSAIQTTLPQPNYNLMGITLENKIKLNANSYLTAEVAKSSIPYYHATNTSDGDKSLTGTFNMSDRSNEAYSLKINSIIPATSTRIDAYFKHYGANFQSFTLITTSSEQNAWLMNVNQDLFHNQFTLNGSIRKNDYINPFLDQRYVSNTIFKSIQATLHMPNLPVIFAGFYPTTQLTKLNDQNYMENLFYSLTASASYLYNRRHTMMSTNLMYMRFYNRPADSGFIYYNTNNFFLNHSVFFRTVTLQTSISDAINTNYTLWSWGEDVQIRLRKWLSLGGGFKYNKQSLITHPQIGYTLDGNIKIGAIGTIQFRGEKTYIPSINNKLVANNIGRVTFYRNF